MPLHLLAAEPLLLIVDTSTQSYSDPNAIIDIIQNEIHYGHQRRVVDRYDTRKYILVACTL